MVGNVTVCAITTLFRKFASMFTLQCLDGAKARLHKRCQGTPRDWHGIQITGNTDLHGEPRHLPAYVTNLGMPLYLSFRQFWMQPTFNVPVLANEDNFNANELSLRSADYWQGRNACSLQRDLQGY